ncbi:ABC transporter substrate-binding protein [Bradyrhizobium mercantei]|uniref:ABC transporter substrate-binding protein n=1 Tax=Bradyrhizobium mercantei TaxID=1904807 RepID=UPI000977E4BB|nr:ABC transporter substrate-binding protein [Bradyrhizobium mercantei]
MKVMRLIFVVTLVSITASVGTAEGSETLVKIQDYPGVGNVLFRVAAAKGYCEKHGLKCQLQMVPSGPLGGQALLAKSIDAAFVPPDVQINTALKGAVTKAIMSITQRNPFQLVIRNDLPTPNAGNGFPAFMSDLKGKKIGVPARGSAAEQLFKFLAAKAGLSPEDFTFVAVGSPNTSYGSLISKQVDASMTFEPSSSMCDVLKTCRTLYVAATATEPQEIFKTNGACANLVVTQETIDKPGLVSALIAAAKDAEAFVQDPANFDEVFKIVTGYFKLDLPMGDKIIEASLRFSMPAYRVAISRSALQQFADNMLTMKQIEAPFQTSSLLYADAP